MSNDKCRISNKYQFVIENLKFEIGYSPPKAGFTLIEVLVAATLIGLLATVGLSGFQAVTRSGRDALRKSDLEQIRSALEIYKSENSSYPTATTLCVPDDLESQGYINPLPSDPKSYSYCYVPNGSPPLAYELCAHLENAVDTDSYCGPATNCGGSCNYRVINP